MDRIYNDAEDKNVATIIVYANETGNLFYDKTFTKEVPTTDMVNLFLKGVVAEKDGTYYTAVSCTKNGVISFGF